MSGLDLAGKNCIVTGATGGLGRCIVKHLWRRGANLFLIGHSTRPDCSRLVPVVVVGQSVAACEVELGFPGSIAELFEHRRSFRLFPQARVDALINNAAMLGPVGPLEQNDWADWEQTIRVNLLSPVALCQAVIPFMKEAGGCIVNLSGGGATKARPNFSAYATAKTGLVRFTETLAQEVSGYGIRVNAVAPGRMPTKMNDQLIEAGEEVAGAVEHQDAMDCKCWGGSFVDPAHLIGFLVSDESKGISGKLISATWDDWRSLPRSFEHRQEDVYTLRRVT